MNKQTDLLLKMIDLQKKHVDLYCDAADGYVKAKDEKEKAYYIRQIEILSGQCELIKEVLTIINNY